MRIRAVLVALAVAAFGCSHRPGVAPSAVRSEWIELQSDGFVVLTDLDATDGRELLAALEGVRSYLLGTAYQRAIGAGRTKVIAFAHEGDARAFLPAASDGMFIRRLPNDAVADPIFATFGQLDVTRRETFVHELVHRFNFAAYGGFPPWLEEGLAEYYSTLRIEDDGVTRGLAPRYTRFTSDVHFDVEREDDRWTSALPVHLMPKVDELASADRARVHEEMTEGSRADRIHLHAVYATSWATVHFFMHGPERYRQAFRQALQEPTGSRVANRLQESLALGSNREIDGMLRDYVLKPVEFRVENVAPIPPRPPTVRPLSATEVHILLARFAPFTGASAKGTEETLRSALAAATTPPERRDAHYWLARHHAANGDRKGALDALIDARKEGGEDPNVLADLVMHYANGAVAPPGEVVACGGWASGARIGTMAPEEEEALLALRRASRSALHHDLAARTIAALGHPSAALTQARQAVKADPSCWQCLFTLSCLTASRGDYNEAVRVGTRVVEHLPESLPAKEEATVLEELRKIRDAATPKSH